MRAGCQIILFSLSMVFCGIARAETCNRVAVINYQEVLIDGNSNRKGEGLRTYLEKDPRAKSHLELYQKGVRTDWLNATLGTAGTLLIMSRFFSSRKSGKKGSLLIGGLALIGLNFLIARTKERSNEDHLIDAIYEYNKRNSPQIYFNPYSTDEEVPDFSDEVSFVFGKEWRF